MGSFGMGKNFHYIAAHESAVRLRTESSKALPAFHAFTGCGTVFLFAGKWKAKAWEVCNLASGPDTQHETSPETFEQFVVLVYSKTSSLTKMNEAKQCLFSKSCWSLENIPPSQAALKQHILRAAHQEDYVWGQCLEKDQILLPGVGKTKGQSKPSCWLVRKVSQGHGFLCAQHWTTLQFLLWTKSLLLHIRLQR